MPPLSPRREFTATLSLARAGRFPTGHCPSFLPRSARTRGRLSPSVPKAGVGELLRPVVISSCEAPSWDLRRRFSSKPLENPVFSFF